MKPLAAMALGLAVISLILAFTYFLSPFAYLAAAVSAGLALAARTDAGSRKLATIAFGVAGASALVATVLILAVGGSGT